MAALLLFAGQAFGQSTSARFVALAEDGWGYELRNTMVGRNMAIPVRINGRSFAGASLCIVGEAPTAATEVVLQAFRHLIAQTYGKPLTMRYAGESSRYCGVGRVVVLRLYTGHPPNHALSDDLNRMNSQYRLGLPPGRFYAAMSPAMAQTFFGHVGPATHIMVAQSGGRLTPLETRYYKSILLEELYQAFTFGMDVIVFSRDEPFMSKLQELPVNLRRMAWGSPRFMQALLQSNPNRLCPFDVFMLHAVAQSPVEQTNDPDFIAFIRKNFAQLEARAAETLNDPLLAGILDQTCSSS